MHPAPQRSLANSQNVLRRRALVDQVLAASSIQSGDLVLDLGAGSGLLTERLVQRGCRVIAVEKDATLVATLRQRFADSPAVAVWHLDILEVKRPARPYKVFANIPFDATSAILHHLTRPACPPEDAYLVVQREAAERVLGRPRGTLLAALLFPWFEAAVVHHFHRTDFTPVPRVEVVMLRLRKRGPPLVAPEHARLFRDFVVCLFTARHCSLAKRLGRLLGRRRARRLLRHLAIAPTARPSALSPEQWLALSAAFQAQADLRAQLVVAGAERRLRAQERHVRKLHRTRTRTRTTPRPPPGAPPGAARSRTWCSGVRPRRRRRCGWPPAPGRGWR